MFARVPYTTLTPPLQTRRIGDKRDTSGQGSVIARPPYVALVPWSVPRQSPAASHRVEKHSAVLCRTTPGNRVATSSLSGVRAGGCLEEGAALKDCRLRSQGPRKKSHSSRRMQLSWQSISKQPVRQLTEGRRLLGLHSPLHPICVKLLSMRLGRRSGLLQDKDSDMAVRRWGQSGQKRRRQRPRSLCAGKLRAR
ncbi:hypothetical protein J3F84DRAFT_22180 [Trichoderma pleuroticola]